MLKTNKVNYHAGHVEMPATPLAAPDPACVLTALANLRKLLAQVPATRSLTDELIKERRAEAARE